MASVEAVASQTIGAGQGMVDYHKLKKWLIEGAKPLPSGEHKPLQAGLLYLPSALQAERADFNVKSTPPEIAVRARRR